MKKKLRDCSEEELNEYCEANDCSGCKLNVPNNGCFSCLKYVDKTYLSDKALNIEIDIPQQEILDEEDKKTLIYNCLLLKREHCEDIRIVKRKSIISAFFIEIDSKQNISKLIHIIYLPCFTDKNMFKNMEPGKYYSLQDLGIDLDKYELELKEK
jgi:hypothetical protein